MIHGDLKGVRFRILVTDFLPNALLTKANILIDNSGHARLADFGLLTIVSDPANSTASSSSTKGGTTRWMSPELLEPDLFDFKDSGPTKESDCYAFGLVILEVLSGQAPFPSYKEFTVMRKVIEGERPGRPQGVEGVWFTDGLWETLEQCWSHQPKDRPTVEVVLECLEQVPTRQLLPPSANSDVETDIDDDSTPMVGGPVSSVPRNQLHGGAGRPSASGSSNVDLTAPSRINRL